MGKHYSKKEAVGICIQCAESYKKLLENRNYIFIYQDRETNTIQFFETIFLPRHFMHLTGLNYTDNYKKELGLTAGKLGASRFYEECLNRTIRIDSIQEKADGTTSLKLDALPHMINFLRTANMTVTYSKNRPYLSCDRFAGTTKYAIGFTREKNGFFNPSSCLKEDIRNLGDVPSRVLAIFTKDVSDQVYTNIKYIAKKTALDQLTLPGELQEKISLENYRSN